MPANVVARRSLAQVCLAPLRELWHRPKGQIPALDALRAFAVISVIGFHSIAPYYHLGGHKNWFAYLPFIHSGWFGVDLFFVLSGYFIGRQLWHELKRSSSVHFGRFFVRRGLRIWPLYFATFLWVAIVLGHGDLSTGRGWTDLVFLSNYIYYQGIVEGAWSLCVEEQFYIVAPIVVIAFSFLVSKVEQHRHYLWVALVLVPAWRTVLWYSLTGDLFRHDKELLSEYIYNPFHTHCDGLIAGLIISNFDVTDGEKYKGGFFSSLYFPFAAALVCLGMHRLHPEILYFSGLAIFFGATCWYLLAAPRPWLSFLNSWWFYLLSRLSFGMYLNHFYLLDVITRPALLYLPGAKAFPALHHCLTATLITIASAMIATVTFCCIEHPFLRVRDRWLAKKSTKGYAQNSRLTDATVAIRSA